MYSSNAPMNELGWSMLLRDIEHLYMKVAGGGGDTDPGSGPPFTLGADAPVIDQRNPDGATAAYPMLNGLPLIPNNTVTIVDSTGAQVTTTQGDRRIVLPAATTFASAPFLGSLSIAGPWNGASTAITATGTGFSGNTFTFTKSGTVYVFCSVIINFSTLKDSVATVDYVNTGSISLPPNCSTAVGVFQGASNGTPKASLFSATVSSVSSGDTISASGQYSLSAAGGSSAASASLSGILGGFYLST